MKIVIALVIFALMILPAIARIRSRMNRPRD